MRAVRIGEPWPRARVAWPLVTAAAIALTAFIYLPALRYYLFADDFQWLAGARSFEWTRLLTLTGRTHFYRPIIELYFAGAYRACGLDAECLHALSLAVHLLNIALLAWLARAVFGGSVSPAIAALIFAALPAYTEAVLWVSAMGELLATTFILATVILYISWLDDGGTTRLAGCLVTFAAALLTHETAAVLPALLLLVAFTRARRERITTLPSVAFMLIATMYLAIEFAVNRRNYIVVEGHYHLGWHIVSNLASGVSTLYVGRHDPAALAVGLLIVGGLAVFASDRLRMAAAWILITLVPASMFTWPPSSRYLYLPGVGFALLMAELLLRFDRVMRRRAGRAGAVVVTAAALFAGVRFAVFARTAVRNYAPVGNVYRDVLMEARLRYPAPAAGSLLVLRNPDPRLVAEQYVEVMVRLEYDRPDLRVTLVNARP